MKNKLKLLLILMTSVLFFTSCEKEEFEVTVQASPVQTAHQVRKISFGELKRNRSAFETLKESRSKLKASSLLHRGVYNDDFGVFIDTTTILVTEKDGKHSITFRIFNEEEVFKIKNLVLNAKEDGSYKAYITEYILSQAELTKLANNEPIGEKYPSAVTDVSTYSRFSIEGDGAGCIEVRTYTVRYCNNSSGQTIVNTGTNGGNSSDCYNGFYEVEYQTIIIYAGCLSDGGGGGGNNPGGDIPGYNPGDGNGNSGGGSSSGGNTGNPDPGNNGNPTDPNQNLNDGHTPIITTPVLTIDKREVRLYNQLNASQQAWWNSAPAETKNALLDYFNQNSPNNIVTAEAMAFILELIDLANNEEDKEIIPNLINLSIVTKQNGYFENSFDSNYYNLINPYTEVDTEMYNPLWGVYFTVECAVARYKLSQEPGWNDLHPWVQDAKVYWEASKEMIHLGLDLIGLVPVVGEVADLTNGVIYTIEGDGVNASLSFASTIPVAGWFSVGVKFAKRADGLTFAVKAGNTLIDFGKYNSKKFREALGLMPGDPRQAHHLIPRQFAENPLVQKAAQANTNQGFHMHSALNGIPMPTTNHLTGHNLYSQKVLQRLNYLNTISPTPQIAFQQINNYINDIKIIIQNNPNMNLGQISNLID